MKYGIAAALLAVAASAPAPAATAWDERPGAQGDLSDDRLSPTPVLMALGHNIVTGTTGDAGHGVDRDYFRFSVPTGTVLSSLMVMPTTSVSGSSSFIALQAGPQITVTPTGGGNLGDLYGLMHYENQHVGTDILPLLVGSAAKWPVPSGTYSVWVQETGGEVAYSLDFVITAVPEPASALSLGLGLFGLACRRFVLQRR